MMQTKNRSCHGMGIATVALIDNTVKVTMRQSDSVPIASEVAIAPSKREEATGARLLSKPTAPGDRIIGLNPCNAGRITRDSRDIGKILQSSPAILRRASSENGQIAAKVNLIPAILTFGGALARK
jgi:hypothetical protein